MNINDHSCNENQDPDDESWIGEPGEGIGMGKESEPVSDEKSIYQIEANSHQHNRDRHLFPFGSDP